MKNNSLKSLAFFLYLGLFHQNGICQNNLEKRVDSLFSKWNTDSTPGYAIGIIKDSKLLLAKGYGMANLEYKVPLTAQSPFYIGSMSKQFTAACLLWLVENKKINLTDDIHLYLPEMPQYKWKITIENLLHHTSVIREVYYLKLYQGSNNRFEDYFDNNIFYRLICQQKGLNFEPQTRYNYSSSNYILLTKIIEQISGKTLRQFADEHIFKPLGMTHTFFNDNYAEIIPNRVESYRPILNGFERYNKNFNTYGDGGLITTVEDLAKWDNAFYADLLGIKNFANKMYQQGVLSNDHKIDYAWAVQVRDYNGRKTIEHNGGMLAFVVDLVRFPDQKFTAIVMSNSFKDFPTYLAYQLSDIYLGKNEPDKPHPIVKQFNELKINTNFLKKYAGKYWNINENYYNEIVYQNDSLFYDNTFGYKVYLQYVSKDSFQLFNTNQSINFYKDKTDSLMRMNLPSFNNPIAYFKKYNPAKPQTIEDLDYLLGDYFSSELQTSYHFFKDKGKVYFQINDQIPRQIFPEANPFFWNSRNMLWIGFAEIIFKRANNTRATSLSIGDNRVSSIIFNRY